LSAFTIPPCDRTYQSAVRNQVNAIQASMVELFVEPAVLGAGQCLRGEAQADAQQRVDLYQKNRLSEFDGLNADASALFYQLLRDGSVLQTVGAGLLAGQAATLALAGAVPANRSMILDFAQLAEGTVGDSLIVAGFGLQSVADIFGKISNSAVTRRAEYERWAILQTPAVLANCAGTAVPGAGTGPVAPPFTLAMSLAALADTQSRIQTGCSLPDQAGMSLAVCNPAAIGEFAMRNGTLGAIYNQGFACLGSTGTEGVQLACGASAIPSTLGQRLTLTYFDEMAGVLGEAGDDALAFGNGFFAGSESFIIASNAASAAGFIPQADALLASASGLSALGDGLFAGAFDLWRITALVRSWQTYLARSYNAQALSLLDQREARARAAAQDSPSEPATGQPAGTSGVAGGALENQSTGGSMGPNGSSGGAVTPPVVPGFGTVPSEPPPSSATRIHPLHGLLLLLLLPAIQ
jgi:hypothetical protein